MKTKGKKYIVYIAILTIFLLVALIFLWYMKFYGHKIKASSIEAEECKSIVPERYIFFEDLGLGNFTCTGITYDKVDDSFWVADHGTETTDAMRLIECDRYFENTLSVIQIGNLTVSDGSLQGVVYDNENDTLWVAIGDFIYEVSKSGELLKSISIPEFQHYKSNGICMDEDGTTMWVLCYSSYLLHIDKDGNILERYDCNYADQDMIYMHNGKIYITAGADYNGEENYCVIFDVEKKKFEVQYQLIGSNAVEGIFVSDSEIFVLNDGYYHNAKIKKSYISVYTY